MPNNHPLPSEVLELAAEIRASARAHGDELTLDDAIVKAFIRLPDLLIFGAAYDAWVEAEAARVEALLDTLHDALDSEVAHLVSAA